MIITIIAALSENRVIGRNNDLPWDLPEDRKRFRTLTMGHPVIMGRRTFASLPRPLDGRTVIVLSRNSEFSSTSCTVSRNLQEALDVASGGPGGEECFIAGGGELYRQALQCARRLYLTLIHRTISGDVTFPELPAGMFREISREDLSGSLPATYICLERY